MPDAPSLPDTLDDVLTRIQQVRQRPSWRRRVLAGGDGTTSISTVRALRAVEQRQGAGAGASVSDVADHMAVEHSTASRTVAALVSAGLMAKSPSVSDQRRCDLTLTDAGRDELARITERRHQMIADTVAHWSDDDLGTLISLLERLGDDLERAASI
ncbi:MarR family transcriptional regulator [Gordonia sp. LSe1-13]|uniref:MarR family transcriptional regulator n=1 Tax=Gordonia sesuvii TaxID=3116777 RepID=A0ABU7MIZ3_9ACTN|nr:MarR family transcriptional regulator [Gordonia sp. LSe1-13]